MHAFRMLIAAVMLCCAGALPAQTPAGPLVFAAASLQESLNAAADAYATTGRVRPLLSFAASSALARQIASGAPADVFISADTAWMDDIAAKRLVRAGTRTAFLSNRLVLVTPVAQPLVIKIRRGFLLAAALGDGKLAMADPDSVPAGRYARAALVSLGVWTAVEPKLVRTENVRAALAFVSRGEARAGIVYATDARADPKVRVAGVFPANSHPPIVYPLAILAASRHPDAARFRSFLLSSAGRKILARYGFGTPVVE